MRGSIRDDIRSRKKNNMSDCRYEEAEYDILIFFTMTVSCMLVFMHFLLQAKE